MSFAGHVIDMINRAKYNESLKEARRDRYRRVRDAWYDAIKWNPQIRESALSKEEIEMVKQKIRNKLRREALRTRIINTVILIAALFGVGFGMYRYFFL